MFFITLMPNRVIKNCQRLDQRSRSAVDRQFCYNRVLGIHHRYNCGWRSAVLYNLYCNFFISIKNYIIKLISGLVDRAF